MFDDLLTPVHLIVLGIVGLLVFGPKRLPELGAGLGHALRGFRQEVSDDVPSGEACPPHTDDLTEPTPTALTVVASSDLRKKTEHPRGVFTR